jgi:hypothetical protein
VLLQNVISALSTVEITEVIYEFRLNRILKSSISITKTIQLKLFMEITTLHSEDHIKHVNTPRGQNAQVLNVKVSGTVTSVIQSVRGQRLRYYTGKLRAVCV